MLQDYRNYIKNIRNGLIQCGVEVSISPLSTYRDLFYEANKLSQILWFYSIMQVSGSPLALDDFFINLGKYYKEEMRQRFYVEFQDYLDSYKNISKLAYLAGESSDSKIKDIELDETFDIFGELEDDDTTNDSVEEVYEDNTPINLSNENFEEVHGTFLENIDFYYNVDKVLGTGYIPSENSVKLTVQDEVLEVHGTYIDEVSIVTVQNSNTLSEDSFVYESHGVILDDIEVNSNLVYEEDDEVYDDTNYSNEDEDEYIEENLEEVDDYCDINYSDEEEEYDDINYSYEDDDDYCDINYPSEDEDDDDYCDINYSDDEEEYFEEEDDNDYCDINYASDEDDDDGMIVTPKVQHQQTSKHTTNIVQANVKQGDMSDALQKGVNDILTKGKRFIMTRSDRSRDYEKK